MRGLALLLLAALLPAADQVRAVFVVADAFVKDRLLPGAAVGLARSATGPHEVTGRTGADGRWTATVAAGTWYATFRLDGYVAVERTQVVLRPPAQEVTTALSMLLEEEGRAGQRRVRAVLTWGSGSDQVRDLDAHAVCSCTAPCHVFFSRKEHPGSGHRLDLDVDDTDWGGPETITLLDPPPGSYRYWVYDYSGGPGDLARSDVVVRVFAGDRALGEWRPDAGQAGRVWAPFRSIQVDGLGDPQVVPWTADELVRGLAGTMPADAPAGVDPGEGQADQGQDEPAIGLAGLAIAGVLAAGAVWLIVAVRSRARS